MNIQDVENRRVAEELAANREANRAANLPDLITGLLLDTIQSILTFIDHKPGCGFTSNWNDGQPPTCACGLVAAREAINDAVDSVNNPPLSAQERAERDAAVAALVGPFATPAERAEAKRRVYESGRESGRGLQRFGPGGGFVPGPEPKFERQPGTERALATVQRLRVEHPDWTEEQVQREARELERKFEPGRFDEPERVDRGFAEPERAGRERVAAEKAEQAAREKAERAAREKAERDKR